MLPKWLEVALSELQIGMSEVPGPASNTRIAAYLALVGQDQLDEIPWCAAFVGHCLEQAGLKGTGKPNARSYLDWGKATQPWVLGAVGVLWRGTKVGWQGHVGFVLDVSDSSIYLLGGNQGDRVSVSAYPRDRILGARWPIEEGPSSQDHRTA